MRDASVKWYDDGIFVLWFFITFNFSYGNAVYPKYFVYKNCLFNHFNYFFPSWQIQIQPIKRVRPFYKSSLAMLQIKLKNAYHSLIQNKTFTATYLTHIKWAQPSRKRRREMETFFSWCSDLTEKKKVHPLKGFYLLIVCLLWGFSFHIVLTTMCVAKRLQRLRLLHQVYFFTFLFFLFEIRFDSKTKET